MKKRNAYLLNKKEKIMCFLYLFFVDVLLFNSMTAKAGAISSTSLVKGTQNLISDITSVLTGLSAAVTIVAFIIQRFRLQFAEENEVPSIKKWERRIVTAGIIICVASVLINAILSYYGGTTQTKGK